MTKVSIIVPVYNNATYLKTCLNSLINQTLDDVEIIIIDDCSTDLSYKILEDYKSNYPNIILIKNDKNYGQGKTRNIGLSIANGEYIGFVDSDDYVSPEMYKNMYEGALKNNFPDIITTGLLFVKDDSYANKNMDFAFANGRTLSLEIQKDRIVNVSPSVCNKLFNRNLIDKYRFLENCKWEDIAFTTIMFLKAKSIFEFNNPDYFYRRSITRGISSINYQPNSNLVDIFKVIDEIVNMSLNLNKKEPFYDQINIICISSILQRINEINCWNIEADQKEQIKEKIYDILFNRYKELLNVNLDSLQGKVNYKIIEELKNKISKKVL